MQAIARVAIVLVLVGVCSNAAESGASRSIEGVIATFRIMNPLVKPGDPLRVLTVYRNISFMTVHFPFMNPNYFSEIFRKGQRAPVTGYYMGTPSVEEVILKPFESVEFEEELSLAGWEHLSPGDYEIQFCFHLGMLPEAIEGNYPREYPYDSLVIPWSDQRYQFTIAK
jgi:hypothetical protein